ncbi:3',5'-cyclic-nucleotide phosphodiesterase regA [Pelomyxa schiedti]|nr:3',5'-cyclic-nucleotide phosphodiesterase regA [Pelomyxa schiedti]
MVIYHGRIARALGPIHAFQVGSPPRGLRVPRVGRSSARWWNLVLAAEVLAFALAITSLGGVGATTVSSANWGVCTLEGLMALSDSKAATVNPVYSTIQKMVESMGSMISFLDVNDRVSDFECSYLHDYISFYRSGTLAGCGTDMRANRTIEGYVTQQYLVPVAVNTSESCACNPFWSNWVTANYEPGMGITCENYTEISRILALSTEIPSIAASFTETTGLITRTWGFEMPSSTGTYVVPWKAWRDLHLTLAEVMNEPNAVDMFHSFITPDSNPSRSTYWSGPYFRAYDMTVQCITPVYGKNDRFLGAAFSSVSLAQTSSIFEGLVVTPNGFALLLNMSGCIISASEKAFKTLFGYYNFSHSLSACLNQTELDFSEFLGEISHPGYSFVSIGGVEWVFTRSFLSTLDWAISLAAPITDFIQTGDFKITPAAVLLKVSHQKYNHYEWTVTLNNSGTVPLMITLANFTTRRLSSNISGSVTLGNGLSFVGFSYTGDVPFDTTLEFLVHDIVTNYSLCYKVNYFVEVSIILEDNSQTALVGGVAGAIVFFLLVVSTVLFFILQYFRHKASVLSQPLTSTNILDTPAEAVIKRLSAIRKKHSRLSPDDKLAVDKIIQLIANDELHKTDYVSQKKSGLVYVDSEVDAFLLEHLIGANQNSVDQVDRPEVLNATHGLHDRWSFFIFDCAPDTALIQIGYSIFNQYGLLKRFSINEELFRGWLKDITSGYLNNPYHNSIHAADVLQALHVFVQNLTQELPALNVLALFFSAVVHDLGHPGVNNNFLMRIRDPVFLLYNGISILESMHCSEAFRVTLNGVHNWLTCFNPEQFLEFHNLVTQTILATDMSRHVEITSQFNSKTASGNLDWTHKEDIMCIMKMLLKLADISNPVRPWNACSKWANMITEENFMQGDQEARRSLTKSPFMDRVNQNIPKCQSTFISFVVSPLVESMSKILKAELATELQENVSGNLKRWTEMSPSETNLLAKSGGSCNSLASEKNHSISPNKQSPDSKV